MADKSALTLINGDVKAFLDQVERDMEKVAGLRWDDLIIRLEWRKEQKAIIKLMNKQDGPKATELKEVLESHAYKFSLNTVKTWIGQDRLTLLEQINADGYIWAEFVAKRLKELTDDFVNRMQGK